MYYLRVAVQLRLRVEIRLVWAPYVKVVGVGVGDVLLLSIPGSEESLASRTIHVRVLTLSILLERSLVFKLLVAMPAILYLSAIRAKLRPEGR